MKVFVGRRFHNQKGLAVIRFACPICHAQMEAPPHAGSQKIACLNCGQRLQIPELDRSKTILAPLVGGKPSARESVQSPLAPAIFSMLNDPSLPRAIPVGGKASPVMLPMPRRRRAGYRVALFVVCGAAFVFVAVALLLRAKVFPSVGSVAEARPYTRNDAEELVKKYILNNASDPKGVKFTRWGPHMMPPEVAKLVEETGLEELPFMDDLQRKGFKGVRKLTLIRVCVEGEGIGLHPWINGPSQHAAYDLVFIVYGKLAAPIAPNPHGDDWKAEARKQLAKMFPAVNTGGP